MAIQISGTIQPKHLHRRMQIAAERSARLELWQASTTAQRIEKLGEKIVDATGPATADWTAPPFPSRPRWQRKLLRLYCKIVLKATRFITVEQRKQNTTFVGIFREMADLVRNQQMELLRLQQTIERQNSQLAQLREALADLEAHAASRDAA